MGVAGVVGGGVVAGSADFVDMLAVDWKLEERDVDQEGEEEPLMALKVEEAAFALPELMHQEEFVMASQPQHQEWFLHFESTQEEMVLESLALQVLGNYQSCDHQ